MSGVNIYKKFELENYTAESRNHMLPEIEKTVSDDVFMAYEDWKEASKLCMESSNDVQSLLTN